MNSQIDNLRSLSTMPIFVNNPNTPIAKALKKILKPGVKKCVSKIKKRVKPYKRSRLTKKKNKKD